MQNLKDITLRISEEHIKLLEDLKSKIPVLETISLKILEAIKNGKKILVCGNGGSAAESQHFSAELVGRFQKERKPIRAISLTTDTSVITSLANDYSFNTVFARQVEALGDEGDVLIGFSTSGNSENVIEAFKKARDKKIITVAIVGKEGKIKDFSDFILGVNAPTARVQEIHSIIVHIICEYIENSLFP